MSDKLVEKYDDNPGAYFGMLVEGLEDKEESLKEGIDKKQIDLLYSRNGFRDKKFALEVGHPDNIYNELKYFIKEDGMSSVEREFRVNVTPCAPKDIYKNSISVREFLRMYEQNESLKEDKFVPQDKMSKKAQKELNDKKRGTWGNTNPVTRVQPNKKAYDRKRDKKVVDESFDNDVNVLVNLLSDKYCDEDGIVTKDSYDSVYKYLGKNYSEKIRDAVMDNLVTEFGLPAERDKKVVDEDIENKDSEEYLGVDEVKRFVNAREKLLDISDSMTTDLRLGRISREDVLYYRNEIKEIYSFLNNLYFGR